MLHKASKTSFTLNARDPIPDPSGNRTVHGIRPPPKLYHQHKDTHGYSKQKIRKMIEQKEQYDEECKKIEAETEIANFEARQKDGDKAIKLVPKLPIQPNIDYDVVHQFEVPSVSRYYNYATPNIYNNQTQTREPKKCMHHGCPCCNPDTYDFIRSRSAHGSRTSCRPATTQSRCLPVQDDLPRQISTWNRLDEPCIPDRPQTRFREYSKPAQWSMLRTGPRPGGIPIVVNDLVSIRQHEQEKFEAQQKKLIAKEKSQREKELRRLASEHRAQTAARKERTTELSMLSGQKWATGSVDTREIPQFGFDSQPPPLSQQELESYEELKKIDDQMYKAYKDSKKPTDEFERLLYESGMKTNFD